MQALTVAPPAKLQGQADVYALLDRWLDYLKAQVAAGTLSNDTRATYERGAGRFIDWCFNKNLRAVSNTVILDWLADLRAGYSIGSANTWLSGVRAFFAWAVGAGALTHNPCSGIKGLSRRNAWGHHKRDALTNAEMKRLLKHFTGATPADKRNRALVALMAYNALRSVEIHRANVEHLKTVSGKLVLMVHGKGQVEASDLVVLAHPAAIEAVHDWLAELKRDTGPLFVSLSDRSPGARLSLSAIRWIVKAAYAECGIVGKDKTTHSLRHSAITNAIRNQAPIQKVQTMARHADISTTMIYFHETDRVEHPAEDFVSYDSEN